tara:strand:- start:513 stop:719 length:207 start_codon:yes stop_codon:yes gene_type:complete
MKNDKLFSIEQLENSDNSILERVAERISDDDDRTLASHSSHSSSSGRGHTSHVSGTAGSIEKEKSKNK